MTYHRVVIERIPRTRLASHPAAPVDAQVASQTPVSCWLDIPTAYQLMLWLKGNYPILTNDAGDILIYALQESDWPEGQLPPAPAPFVADLVRDAHGSYKQHVVPIAPPFGEEDWKVIGDALATVRGERERTAKRTRRWVMSYLKFLRKREERVKR
jgi:hypothetical protein